MRPKEPVRGKWDGKKTQGVFKNKVHQGMGALPTNTLQVKKRRSVQWENRKTNKKGEHVIKSP